MRSAYANCRNLTGSPVCGEKIRTTGFEHAYAFCHNLTGSPICGENVTSMRSTYCYCRNLTGSPVCGKNVVIMSDTYMGCINLTGSPICGENVTDMSRAYQSCDNLTGSPVCGENVVDMWSTYEGCKNLSSNGYFYSNKITNIELCFGNRNIAKPLNLYLPANSTSLTTALSNTAATSMVGADITWTNDTANNRYYNTQYNIYIYPVANVAAARAANGD